MAHFKDIVMISTCLILLNIFSGPILTIFCLFGRNCRRMGWSNGCSILGNNMLTPGFVLLTNNNRDARDQIFKLYISL
jgi:hypothetical protein